MPDPVPLVRGSSVELGEARVIVERLAGPAALAALAPALCAMRPPGGRTIGVLCAPARGSDAEIRECAALAGRLFDGLVLTAEDEDGLRPPSDALGLLTTGLLAAGVCSSQLVRLVGEADAVAGALAIARPGDLVVVLSPDPERVRARLSAKAAPERQAA